MNRYLITVSVLFLLTACNRTPPMELASEETTLLQLIAVDTIGIEFGDERFVFGDICSVSTDFNGNLIVLDAITCNVRRYSPSGEYLGEFAGSGSGPGELIDPMAMALLSGGGIAIADWAAWGIYLYDRNYDYCDFIGPMAGGSPLSLATGADNSVIGLGVTFWSENEQPAGEYFLASWSDSVSETFRFTSGTALTEPSEGGEVTINLPTLYFDSSPSYEMYVALSTDSTFIVQHFSATGEEVGLIEEEWEKIPLNSMSMDLINAESRMHGEEISSEKLYADAVVGIHCDSSGNVWVRLGTSPHPLFNVYNASGEFVTSLEASELSDPLFELDFLVSGENVFAWNTDPIDFPKVLILTNPL